MSRVLIIEDEQHLADGLRFNLEAEGYEIEIAADGEAGLRLLLGGAPPFDAVVLDIMLPGKNGFEVAADLRARGQFVPILMLTARGRSDDVLKGFEAGADDYLSKPFDLAILFARLKGLLRRRDWLAQQSPRVPRLKSAYSFDGKTIDFELLELRTGDRTVKLTLMEADLLRYLVTHENQIVSRRKMLEDVWGLRDDTDTRAIDNFIVRLRKYIELDPAAPRHLVTVRGVGYRFVANP
jgi:DNA-binding response OmpR family regulator